jgi:hypothetical protein
MRQSIVTKYHGPTSHKGSRVSARASAGRCETTWEHSLSSYENHRDAAIKLAKRWGWSGRLVGGSLPDGTGYVFVWVDADDEMTISKDGSWEFSNWTSTNDRA